MYIDKIHPQLRSAFAKMPTIPLHNALMLKMCKLLMPIMQLPTAGPGVVVENRKLKHRGVRIYRPEGALSRAALLWIHGGGHIIGTPKQDDRLCGALARDLGIVIVSVGYRLAPEHKYPGAIDDCFDAWQWLQLTAPSLGVDSRRVVVGGQSAGGGLATVLAQRIHDSGGIQPAGQLLLCPMLDDRTALRPEFDGIDYAMWTALMNRRAWTWYLGQPAGAPTLPPYAAGARREDLSGLPKTWVSIGDIELFYDEALVYVKRLQEAGVACSLHESSGAPHGFESVAPDAPLTHELLASAYAFLRGALDLPQDQQRISYGSKTRT